MTSSGPPYARTGNERVEHEALVVQQEVFESHGQDSRIKKVDISPTLTAKIHKGSGDIPLVKESIPIHDKATRYKGGGDGRNDDGASNFLGVGAESDPMYSLTANDKHMVFHYETLPLQITTKKQNGSGIGDKDSPSYTLSKMGNEGVAVVAPTLTVSSLVRRLTPLECERLQGFPDNYTQIPWKGKSIEECPDGHRYKALGNSMAVPVMRWIGERIELLDSADLTNRASAKTTQQMTLW
tara:strand:+ start:229 stop:948 length:720 start_codon:yes stop_codon:yes gene_type:complete